MFAHLSAEARQIIEALYGLQGVDVSWEMPKQADHGDIATSVALRLAKGLSKNPKEVAEEIADKLNDSPSVHKVEVAGPGYINVWLTVDALIKQLDDSVTSIRPKSLRRDDAPVVIDYSSPNIAKPLGIHHILSTVIGQTLANFYEHDGRDVVKWNYLGDWGTQFGKLALAYQRFGDGKPASDHTLDELLALYVRFHDEAEKDESLEEESRMIFKKLEEGDEELRAFWSAVVEVTKQSLASIYDRLQVSFDVDKGESTYEDSMQPIVDEGVKKGVFTTGDKGALIATFSEESGMPPAVIVKADGATLYHTRDLALMRDRIDTYHPSQILYVVDIAQQLHFKQLFDIADQLKWELPTLEHVYFGRMRFTDSSMSTRKGNILRLEEVLDEAVKRAQKIIDDRGDAIQSEDAQDLAEMMGVGALVYGILSQNRKMDMVFDWDKMLSFEGNSAPYLQYTHARARSILRKADISNPSMPADLSDLQGHDRALLSLLLQFPQALAAARTDHLPHKLATYLYELCQSFNAFYNAVPILNADEPERGMRLALTAVFADVLKTGASLLTIRVPERM